jgi:hypothetical protein
LGAAGPAAYTGWFARRPILLPLDHAERRIVDVVIEHSEGPPEPRLGPFAILDFTSQQLIGFSQLAYAQLKLVVCSSKRIFGSDPLRNLALQLVVGGF